ncbi:hypothetical protein ABZ783_07095 [Micromonospora sp. NPDC047738]|uniref:hypothetical protein n=1 Tax=Micromonospora sp. NPDC047738 TaxID=3155741 RepID=UPI00340AB252
MAHLTRDQILARKIGKGTATLPDGSTVAIRALTRDEVLEAQESGRSLADRDNFIISRGMTDPKLTEEEVAAWAAEADAGDLTSVSDGIAVLSGLKPGAGKESTKSPA